MNARHAAAAVARRLGEAGVAGPGFEGELLVRTAGRMTRASYFAGAELTLAEEARLACLVARRAAREPAAYIAGVREFYGREFEVGPGVLVPRPETELLVDLALAELDRTPGVVVADIGTGSGCVAVSVAAERPIAIAIATDVSGEALAYARRNARRHAPGVRLVRGDLASALRHADVVLANLPYVPAGEIDALEPEVSRWEPRIALDGGPDGLALVRRLIDDCSRRLRPALLALELGFGQAPAVADIAAKAGAAIDTVFDLAGIERVVCARWR